MKKSRRGFLEILLFFGSLGFVRSTVALPVEFGSSTNLVARRLAALLIDQRSARIIGREYLRAYPREANAEVLLSKLCTPGEREAIELVRYDAQNIARIIKKGQQSDFESHRTVKLRGWTFSRTECRLCALCTLV